ncbi:MAG: DnaJ domain-containing protein [Betaproteobacteria bacterium]|nr:DnaJ domain-containing protein [Betaproteobacteria bacterium]
MSATGTGRNPMGTSRETLYDALGVPRDAKHGEIVRAHDGLVAEFRRDTTPPDPRRETRIREAFEVLSDEERRAEYDRSLAAAPSASDRRPAGAIAAVLTALVALAAYLYLGRGAPSLPAGRTVQEIESDVVNSVGRVQSIDLSGTATATGLAFTIANGVMATTCEGLAPGAQIVVTIGKRTVPARIAMADEGLGLCKLAVDGAGSWPLRVGGTEPKVGDKVYAADVNSAGDVVLTEGFVKHIAAESQVRIVDAGFPAASGNGGRPLLDNQGRVVAVATASQLGGAARHVIFPAAWAAEASAVRRP